MNIHDLRIEVAHIGGGLARGKRKCVQDRIGSIGLTCQCYEPVRLVDRKGSADAIKCGSRRGAEHNGVSRARKAIIIAYGHEAPECTDVWKCDNKGPCIV